MIRGLLALTAAVAWPWAGDWRWAATGPGIGFALCVISAALDGRRLQ